MSGKLRRVVLSAQLSKGRFDGDLLAIKSNLGKKLPRVQLRRPMESFVRCKVLPLKFDVEFWFLAASLDDFH